MPRDWTSDYISIDHKDIQANTLAVDPTGQYALLAGRRHMGIVELKNPSTPVYKHNRHSKWDVTTAQWSAHNSELFAIACNQRAELYCWKDNVIKMQSAFRGHTRIISDIDWSKFNANLLATASIDTYINIWDIRDERKPSITLSAVAAASQVKWNKKVSHMLATSHESDVRIWDSRRTSSPVHYLTAHLSKIHSIDWSPTDENILATASQDTTVKFWDVAESPKKDEMLSLRCPVWRAQFTPFGHGLVTVVVPPLRRGDNSLFLWNLQNLSAPVHTFIGHSDVVVEFGWRKRDVDSKDYQLVTWSKDQSLRLWDVDVQLQKSCGLPDEKDDDGELSAKESDGAPFQNASRDGESGDVSTPASTLMRSISKKGSISAASVGAQPQNLQQEFSLVNINIPNMSIDEMDAVKRSCTVTAASGKYIVCLKLLFPNSYPFNSSPSFEFCGGTNVDQDTCDKLLQVLKIAAEQQVRRNRSCLEPCLRQLVHCLDGLAPDEKDQQQLGDSPCHYEVTKKTSFISTPHYGFQDVSVPFPRTSGARFCGADKLVVFTRPLHLQRIKAPTDVTPRSLSALAAYISSHVLPMKQRTSTSSPAQCVFPPMTHSPDDASVSISSFYRQERKQKPRKSTAERRTSGPKTQSTSGAVLIYSVTKLMPINQILAQDYFIMPNDVHGACLRNRNVAAAAGLKDFVQIWSLLSYMSIPIPAASFGPDSGVPWAYHPFGRKLLQSLINYYIEKNDVQTAAMLTCLFNNKQMDKVITKKTGDISGNSSGNVSQLSGKWWLKPGGSPYHTVVPSDNASETWIMVGAALKRNRSNSWSDSLEDYRLMENSAESKDFDRDFQEWNNRLLDPKLITHYDQFKKAYSDILYRWNLLEQRAQVLKCLSSSQPEKCKGIDFITECHNCHQDVTGPQCGTCKSISFCCTVCHLGVKGPSSFCISCGHGGHAYHMQEWFEETDLCPSGCGCICLLENNILGT